MSALIYIPLPNVLQTNSVKQLTQNVCVNHGKWPNEPKSTQ